jgi:uncharacterized membrane protein
MGKGRVQIACRLALIGTFISFVGWSFEKLGRFIVYGAVGDRGFVWLPLCPIYGISIVLIFLLFGTPTRFSGIIGTPIASFFGSLKQKRWLAFLFYFILATAAATLTELITGLLMMPFGVRLWDYSERFLNLWGIICVGFSLLWGALITLFMAFLWLPLYRLVSKLPERLTVILGITFSAAVAVDFIINTVLLILSV